MDDNTYEKKYSVTRNRDKGTGKLVSEFWKSAETGMLENPDGASRVFYDPKTGNKLEEFYDILDKIHRDENEGSAHRKYHPETGNLIYEAYIQYDKKNRSDHKPAVIGYDPYTGEATKWEFFKRGRRYKPPEEDNVPPPPSL